MSEQPNPPSRESPYRLEVEMRGSQMWTVVRHNDTGELICGIGPGFQVVARWIRSGDPAGPAASPGTESSTLPLGTLTYDSLGRSPRRPSQPDSIDPPKSTGEAPPSLEDEPPPDDSSTADPPQ